MTSPVLQEQAKKYVKKLPDVRPGYTIRVHEKITERGKERLQPFEGLVIAVHRGKVPTDTTFTVRRIVSGIGVEKVFPLHSPKISKIDVKKIAKVRRAKLTFLRGRRGKAARLSERFTTKAEFEIAVAKEEPKVEEGTNPSATSSGPSGGTKGTEVAKQEPKKESAEEQPKEKAEKKEE